MALIQYITRIQFGFGSIETLSKELNLLEIHNLLLVTDKGIRSSGILDRVLGQMNGFDYQVFDDTPGNPNEAALNLCLEMYRDSRCDGIIALGGGSPIDLAKAVALLVSQGGVFADYNVKTGGSARIKRVNPHIAIPTAAGTGAEVGRASVLTTNDGRKTVASSLNMVAHSVICDPELTVGLPPKMTAATGIDAFSHGLEAYVSHAYNPPAQAISLDCVSRAGKNLLRVFREGNNMAARSEMMMAALEGGMSLQRGLGAIHAMSNPIGELGFHHGTINGVLLPHVIRYNRDFIGSLYSNIKKAIGLPEHTEFEDFIADLVEQLELPSTLRELGVESKQIKELAEKAALDHLSATNPRPMEVKDYEFLLNEAMG